VSDPKGACWNTTHNLASLELIQNRAAHQAPVAGLKLVSRIVDCITSERFQFIDLTSRINEIVGKSGLRDGLVHLQSLHTTTAVFVNEWQAALLRDMRTFLEGVVSGECVGATMVHCTLIASATMPIHICVASLWGKVCAYRCGTRPFCWLPGRALFWVSLTVSGTGRYPYSFPACDLRQMATFL